MTKPSYEELDVEKLRQLAETVLDKYRLEKESNYSRPDQIDAAETRFYAAATPQAILQLLLDLEAATSNMETYEAENLRVRGLLQRLYDNLGSYRDETAQQVREVIKPLLGPESADIGKLDAADKLGKFIDDSIDAMTPEQLAKFRKDSAAIMEKSRAGADKSGVEMGKVNRVDEKGLQMWIAVEMYEEDWDEPRPLWEDFDDRASYINMAAAALRVFKVSQMSPKELDVAMAGSAETGGEKAAPQLEVWSVIASALGDTAQCELGGHHSAEQLWNALEKTLGWIRDDYSLYRADWVERGGNEAIATFRRSSQNQTVSGGVEGAHEGTTADKSAASPGLLPTQLPKSDF